MTDTGADDRWMTFTELADARRMSRASASKLVRRKGWRRQTDNQGTVRILVPLEAMDSPPDGPSDRPTDSPSDRPLDISRTINALEAAISAWREQAETAEARADRIDAEASALRARLEAERTRADRAEGM